MLIKKLELTNFKSHSKSAYHFSKTNHFFGDNFTGKSSIGDAIVFCLYGVSRHGYKVYIKDYLQEGTSSMAVEMTINKNDNDYIITRTMNAKGTTSVFINNEQVKDKEIEKLLGDYRTFVYSFFPDVFPEEDKSSARSFIIDLMFSKKNDFDELEKEQSRIMKQQKNVNSTKTFYEGQKLLLKKQVEVYKMNPISHTNDVSTEKVTFQAELNSVNNRMQEQFQEVIKLKSQVKIRKGKLLEIQNQAALKAEICPTCLQPVSSNQIRTIQVLHNENQNELEKEIEILQSKIEIAEGHYSNIKIKKASLEQQIEELNIRSSLNQNMEQSTQFSTELNNVENKLSELYEKKMALAEDLKRIKNQLGVVANNYQSQINQYLSSSRIDLFKRLKSGELRPDFQICYKNRPYRVLSNSEKIHCVLEIIDLLNRMNKSSYPLFLDNLESVTHLDPPANIQIFTATVKKGIQLTLKIKD